MMQRFNYLLTSMKEGSNSRGDLGNAYRPDIDSLRAVAVMSVIGFHVFPNSFASGFIGVDIFFVISGYLITLNLLSQSELPKFDIRDFYIRRVIRIFPALIVVLSCTIGMGFFILFADEFMKLGKHLIGGAGFLSNIFYWQESNYFDRAAYTKPLLHLWSLGVEEQFYIFWPVALWIALRMGVSIAYTVISFLILSFWANISSMEFDPVTAFYMPYSRAWELLVGGLVALLIKNRLVNNTFPAVRFYDRLRFSLIIGDHYKIKKITSNTQSLTGLILLLYSFHAIKTSQHFPGFLALLPTLGTAFIILAGSEAWFNRIFLSNRLLSAIGLISYPLYLWHWPVLSFARIMLQDRPTLWIGLGLILISVGLALATYAFIEKPFRYRISELASLKILISSMLVLILIGSAVFLTNGYVGRSSGALDTTKSLEWDYSLFGTLYCNKKFGFGYFDGHYCAVKETTKPVTVVLIGDSHANHYYPGLRDYFFKENEVLLNIGVGGCAAVFFENGCNNSSLNFVLDSPSVQKVVLTNIYYGMPKDSPTLFVEKDLEDALSSTFSKLEMAGKKVYFIYDTPILYFDIRKCLTRSFNKAIDPCAVSRKEVDIRQKSYRNAVDAALARNPYVISFDPISILCDAKLCYAKRDGLLMYRDSDHLSMDGSRYLAEKFKIIYTGDD